MVEDARFGVDEAGRGPVLGSMFIGYVEASSTDLPGQVCDSKRLDNTTIHDLADELKEHPSIETGVVEVPVTKIDHHHSTLTALTARAMAEAIESNSRCSTGVVDACHPDPGVFEELILDSLTHPQHIDVTARHHADDSVPEVQAASIIAKSAREHHVSNLRETYGEIGSGYPSDETTKEFLHSFAQEHGELPNCARTSWQTSRDIVDQLNQSALPDFD